MQLACIGLLSLCIACSSLNLQHNREATSLKEYGEGVDRIYKELAARGLPEIKINNDAFLLKVTAFNHQYGKPEIDTRKPEIGAQNPEIEAQKPEIDAKNPEIDEIVRRLQSKSYNKKTIENAAKLFSSIPKGQVFSSADVETILHCASSSASDMIKKLRAIGAIEEVSGQGKGKNQWADLQSTQAEG